MTTAEQIEQLIAERDFLVREMFGKGNYWGREDDEMNLHNVEKELSAVVEDFSTEPADESTELHLWLNLR